MIFLVALNKDIVYNRPTNDGETGMKDFSFVFGLPVTRVILNGKTKLISSMVLSTMAACALITFVPQLMPLWMAWATGSRV